MLGPNAQGEWRAATAPMLTVGTALGQNESIKGMIAGGNGEKVIIKGQDGNTVSVTLTYAQKSKPSRVGSVSAPG